MAVRSASRIGALIVAIAMSGCMSIRQGAQIQQDLESLRGRLGRLDRLDQERQEQVAEMRKLLDETSALLAANSTDTSTKVLKTEADVAALGATVDEMTRELEKRSETDRNDASRLDGRLAALEQSEARIVQQVAPSLPEDREQLWREAGARLASGQSDEGRRFYRGFIQRFPEDPRASRAYLEIGHSYALERQFAKAAAEFQKVLDAYPRSADVPDAMWQLSMAFVELHFCTDAQTLLADLIRRYPRSSSAPSAQREMKAIRKLPKAVCTS